MVRTEEERGGWKRERMGGNRGEGSRRGVERSGWNGGRGIIKTRRDKE
jgi:hypothetical protein